MYMDKDKYAIKIYSTHKIDAIEVFITRNSMKDILYKILSFGVIPKDNINSEKVHII